MLKWQDALGIVSVALAIMAIRVEDTFLVALCLLLSLSIPCWWVIVTLDFRWYVKIVICGLIFVPVFLFFSYLHHGNVEKSLHQLEGTLVAGNEESPQTRCSPLQKSGGLSVFFGGNVAWIADQPKMIILIMQGRPMIAIERKTFSYFVGSINNISVKLLDLFDDSGRNIVHIDNDDYWVEPASRLKRRNQYELAVYDYHRNEVLFIEYLNKDAIKVRGVFRDSRGLLVTVTDDFVRYQMNGNTVNISGNCVDDYSTAMRFEVR